MNNNVKIASALGIPKDVMIPGKKVRWNISPGDDAMFAQVTFMDSSMHAVIFLNYLSKPVEAIGILASNDQITEITGALRRKSSGGNAIDLEVAREAVRTFHSHLTSMKSGPFLFNHQEPEKSVPDRFVATKSKESDMKNNLAKVA